MIVRQVNIVILIIFICSMWTLDSWGITILEPLPNAVYHAGDEVVVRIQLSPGDNVKEMYIASMKMKKFITLKQTPFEFKYKIDQGFSGKDLIVVDTKMADGSFVDLEVQISVPLPANIKLKSMSVYPTFIMLSKLPAGSDPSSVSMNETEQLGVGGVFSDGIKREISSSAFGTKYSSNNEKVASVSSEGEVKAQGIGTSIITVQNGNQIISVKVVVQQFKE